MDQHAASTDEKWASAKRLYVTVERFAFAAKLAESPAHIMHEIEEEIADLREPGSQSVEERSRRSRSRSRRK